MKIKIKLNEVKRIIRPPTQFTEPVVQPAQPSQNEEEVKITLPSGEVVTKKKKKLLPIEENNKNFLIAAYPASLSLVEASLKNIPVLSEVRIKNKLAEGTQGIVFTLSDDRLLKIYTGSYRGGVQKEDDRYKRLKEKIFSGTGSKSDLPIYDHGISNFTRLVTEFEPNNPKAIRGYVQKETPTQFGWVVMGKVLPLVDYILIKNNMDYSAAGEGNRAYQALFYDLTAYANTYLKKPDPKSALAKYSLYIYPRSVEDIKLDPSFEQEILQKYGYPQTKLHIDQNFPDKFLDEVLQLYIDEGNNTKVFSDLHAGNVGVRNEIDPTPVIFDV